MGIEIMTEDGLRVIRAQDTQGVRTQNTQGVRTQNTRGVSPINAPCSPSKGGSPIMKDTSKAPSTGEFRVSKNGVNGALTRALNTLDVSDRDSDGDLVDEYLKFYLASLPFEY